MFFPAFHPHHRRFYGTEFLEHIQGCGQLNDNLSRNIRKCTFRYVRPAKIQIRIFPVVMDTKFLHVDNQDWSDCADAQYDLSLRWEHM